jgi:predicted metal-binding protein
MSEHTLFICEGCGPDRKSGSPHLLDEVLAADAAQLSGVQIETTTCLWTCDRPCSASLISPGKYTYHFTDLSPDQASALLAFAAQYQDSDDGYVKPPKMPESLLPKLQVRIPSPPVA